MAFPREATLALLLYAATASRPCDAFSTTFDIAPRTPPHVFDRDRRPSRTASSRASEPRDEVSFSEATFPGSVSSIVTPSKEELLTPDEIKSITELVDRRSEARRSGDYDLADSIRDAIDAMGRGGSISDGRGGGGRLVRVPPGYKIELRDIPRKLGGGTAWDVVPALRVPLEWSGEEEGGGGASVLRLSHAAVGLATSAAERNVPIDRAELDAIVKEAEDRLKRTGAAELRGRKAADAAFWFALAGVPSMLDSLAYVAVGELRRFGRRPSCRAKDVMHIVERLAAAGATGEPLRLLTRVAADCLEAKGYTGTNRSTSSSVVDMLREGMFDMHSDRPLLWIWRFSVRQRKQRSFLRVAARQYERAAGVDPSSDDLVSSSTDDDGSSDVSQPKGVGGSGQYDWAAVFDDPILPLVVDIGSGMGVSLHGLATIQEEDDRQVTSSRTGGTMIDLDWGRCNFAGADLSRLAVGYANGIAEQSGVSGRLRFFVDAAEKFLEQVKLTYPGEVRLIMIQFPTPFRLQRVDAEGGNNEHKNSGSDPEEEEEEGASLDKGMRGNSQLPKHPYSGFMVTKELLCCARDILKKTQGNLLMQSNCEDVAVMMRNLATEAAGFSAIDVPDCIGSLSEVGGRLPQRTAEWIRLGGERAEGKGWSRQPLLPRRGATETEVACFLEGTPIHRCAFDRK